MGEDLMPLYEVKYDDGITQWSAFFESEQEATDQAVADTQTYGGVTPQEVVDSTGTTVVTQEEIIAAAEA
jgi:hypothetical protein